MEIEHEGTHPGDHMIRAIWSVIGTVLGWLFAPMTDSLRIVGWFVEALGRVYR